MDFFDTGAGRPGDHRGFVHNSFIGRAVRGTVGRVAQTVSQFLPGPAGPIIGRIGGFITPRGAHRGQTLVPPPSTPTPFPGPAPINSLGGALPTDTIIAAKGGSTALSVNTGQSAPCGFHKAKSTYVRKIDPCQPFQLANLEIVPEGTFIEGNARRRNSSNGKANNNAVNRLVGASRQAVKILKVLGYKTPHLRLGPGRR